MTARDALAAIRERAEAATEGPWTPVRNFSAVSLHAPDASLPKGWRAVGQVTRNWRDDDAESDAEFIAHARTDVPALVEVVEAVLATHVPGQVRLQTLGFDFDTDEYRTRTFTTCAGCHLEHPCPTVTAIETALEGR